MSQTIIFDTNNYSSLKMLFDTICVAYNKVPSDAMQTLFKNEGIFDDRSGEAYKTIKYEHIAKYFEKATTQEDFDSLVDNLKKAAGDSKSFYLSIKTKDCKDRTVFPVSMVKDELDKHVYQENINQDKSHRYKKISEYFGILGNAKTFSEIIDPQGPDLRNNKHIILLLNLAKNSDINIKVIPPVFHEFVHHKSSNLQGNNNIETENQPVLSAEAQTIFNYATEQNSPQPRELFLASINAKVEDIFIGHVQPEHIIASEKATDGKKPDAKQPDYLPIQKFLERVYNAEVRGYQDTKFFYYRKYLHHIVDYIYDHLTSQEVSENFQRLKNICSKYSHLYDNIDSQIIVALDAIKGKGAGNIKGTKSSKNYYAALSKTWSGIFHSINDGQGDMQNANTMYNDPKFKSDREHILEVIAYTLFQRGQEFNFYDLMINAYAKVHDAFFTTANTKMVSQLHDGAFKMYFDDVKILFTQLDYSYSKETFSNGRDNSFRAAAKELEVKFPGFLKDKTIKHLRSVFEDSELAKFFSQDSLDTYKEKLNEYIKTLQSYYSADVNHRINFNTKTWKSLVTHWESIDDTLHAMSFLLKPNYKSYLKINAVATSNRARELSKLQHQKQESVEQYKRVLGILDANAIGGINNNIFIRKSEKSITYEVLSNRQEQFAQILHEYIDKNSYSIETLSLELAAVITPGKVGTSSGLCLTYSKVRNKRGVDSKCVISWNDVDKFNTNEEISEKRNYYKIKIDTEKFNKLLSENTNLDLETQLLDLAKGILAEDSDRIVGHEKYLFSKIVENDGYASWRNNKFLEEMNNIAKSPSSGFSTTLQNRLANAGSRILLIRGIHGTIVSCQQALNGGGSEQNLGCSLSLGEISSSFLIPRGEDALIKKFPKFPKTIRLGGAVLGGVFDIITIVLSTIKLIECAKVANTDYTCSDKEIRDSIAAITFAGVSFASGIILVALSAGGPIGIGVSIIIMVASIIYSGISTIIEWEQKYDTTHLENLQLFISNAFMLSTSKDLDELALRTNSVNSIVKSAWDALNSFPNNTVAYATGLGYIDIYTEVVLKCPKQLKKCETCTSEKPTSGLNKILSMRFTKRCYIAEATARIELNFSPSVHISRVLPDEIAGATFSCLPKVTNSPYEYKLSNSNLASSYPNVRHYCDNAVVIEHDSRKLQADQTKFIVFDFSYIYYGYVKGSNELNNIFFIRTGNPIVQGGHAVTNHFMFLDDKFKGRIYFGNYINIIDASNIKSQVVEFKVDYVNCIIGLAGTIGDTVNLMQETLNDEEIRDTPYIGNLNIQYIGRVNKADHVDCDTVDASIRARKIGDSIYKDKEILNSDSMHIDSNGGNGEKGFDVIKNCKKLTIGPYTKVEGDSGYYTIFVKSMQNEYTNQEMKSTIGVSGTGNIVFLDIALLQAEIKYLPTNTMSISISLTQGGIFTLEINNYFNQAKKTPNFNLIDKYGSVVIPKVDFTPMSISKGSSVFIDKFELHLNSKEVKSLTNQDVVTYYNKVSKSTSDLKVFGTAQSDLTVFNFGSASKDIIVLDRTSMLVKGGEESDIYFLHKDFSRQKSSVQIDNFATDKILDILQLSSIENILITELSGSNDLKISSITTSMGNEFEIIVLNWQKNNFHKHLILIDQQNDYYVPCKSVCSNQGLAQFYMANSNKKDFEVRKDESAVVFTESRNVKLYQIKDSLILSIGNEGSNELILTVKNFYLDSTKWKGLKIYFYKDGDIDYTYSINVFAESEKIRSYSEDRYDAIVSEHTIIMHVDSVPTVSKIEHDRDKRKVGVLVLKNITPNHILATQEEQNLVLTHTTSKSKVIIEKYFTNIKYKIDVIEFSDIEYEFSDTEEPIRIYLCDLTIKGIKLAMDAAKGLYSYGMRGWTKYREDIIKCIVSLHSFQTEKTTINYETLGFVSEHDQILFTSACVKDNSFPSHLDIKFYLNAYKSVLSYRITLKNYLHTKTTQHNDAITSLNADDIISTAQYLGIKHKGFAGLPRSRSKRSDTSFETIDSYESDIADNESDEYDEQQDQLEQVSSSASKTESFIGTWIGNSINTVTHYLKELVQLFGSSASKLNYDDTMSMVSKGLSYDFVDNDGTDNTNTSVSTATWFGSSASKLNYDNTMSMASKGLPYDFVDNDGTDNTNISISATDFNSNLLFIQYLGLQLGLFSKNDTVSHHYLSEEQKREKEIIDALEKSYKLYNDDDYQSENSENDIEEDSFVEEEVNYEHDLYW